ncbi:MAG: C39 family peptidase [Candidatus Magasanikbacteria bacterium]
MRTLVTTLFCLLLPAIAWANTTSTVVNLGVPYTSEIPDGSWIKPWNNACEEAAIVMIEQFYAGNHKARLTRAEAKKLMWPLFGIQTKLWNNNADTDAVRTAKLINDYTSFSAYIKNDPTLEDILNELKSDRPVISFHYGYDLKNPNIPWRRGGSYYHVMPITGFDDIKKEFIVDDPGNHKSGIDYRYKYDIITSSLHDFNHKTGKADGPARVLFTAPKLVRLAGEKGVYYLQYGNRYGINNPQVFKNHKWQWNWVRIVSKEWLESIPLSTTRIKD